MNYEELYGQLLREFPECQARLTRFPSGAFMIDFRIGRVPYTIEHLPHLKGYGLSKTADATFGWEGVDRSFSTLENLAEYIFGELGRTPE